MDNGQLRIETWGMMDFEQFVGGLADEEAVAFLGSVDAEGFPNIKAMLRPLQREGIRVFYLTTNTSSMRVAQFRANAKACLYFCNSAKFQGAMLRGTVEVLTDAASKAMIWREGDTLYYPGGVADSDYCVLRFVASAGRVYEGFKSVSFEV